MDITYRTLLDIVQSDDPSPESQEIKFEERQNVYALLNSLSPLQRKVLMMRYGLNENQEENIFAEIGRQNGVSRENIRLLHNKAIQNIRKFIKERNIKKEDI
jgi:RNA polymerase sigma factor (sigma-70 family)